VAEQVEYQLRCLSHEAGTALREGEFAVLVLTARPRRTMQGK
jgi:hypothetical protein